MDEQLQPTLETIPAINEKLLISRGDRYGIGKTRSINNCNRFNHNFIDL